MYYSKEATGLLKCSECGILKTDNTNIDFYPIYDDNGNKRWLCQLCKVNYTINKKNKESNSNSITMVFVPKNNKTN